MAGFRIPAIDDGDDDPPFGLASGRGGCVAWRHAAAGLVTHRIASPATAPAPSAALHGGLLPPPSRQPSPAARPLLGLRAHGAYVVDLQIRLNRLIEPSPALVVDGEFGHKTRAAVIHYQQRCTPALRVDGLVGPETWGALLEGRTVRSRNGATQAREATATADVPFEKLQPLAPISVLHPIKLHLAPLPLVNPPAWWPNAPPRPYASEPFTGELTNQSVAARLDGDGRVGYTELPPGSCSFKFPEFCAPLKPVFLSSIAR